MKKLSDLLSELNEREENRFLDEYKRKFVEIEVMIGHNQGYNRCLNDLAQLIKEHESELKGSESVTDIDEISEKLAQNLKKSMEKSEYGNTFEKNQTIL